MSQMRFEAKTEAEAVEAAARALGKRVEELKYRVVREEKSFWGAHVVEIEVEGPEVDSEEGAGPEEGEPRRTEPATSEEAYAAVEGTLTELLSAAGFLVEIRRRASPEGMLFELIGDDVEPLLANKGEGLSGLEALAGKIASRRLGQPVYPRLDAEGFRAHQRESLEELAHRSAEEAKRTKRPQLLPPLAPGERRLVHLALANDPDVETQSEGEGYMKRIAVRPKTS